MSSPPASLVPKSNAVNEAELIHNSSCPVLMVCKFLSALVEQQRQAKRVSSEQVAVFMNKISEIGSAYEATTCLRFNVTPVSLSSFAYVFTCLWVYTAIPVVVVTSGADAMSFSTSVIASTSLAFFYFGMYEAGTPMDDPLESVLKAMPIAEMATALSADLTSLVEEDESIPVFLQ